jgi:Ca2+-binding EF-hand superfamily protein
MLSPDATAKLTQAFKFFDKNGDGRLDDAERTAMMTFIKNLEQRRAEPPKSDQ